MSTDERQGEARRARLCNGLTVHPPWEIPYLKSSTSTQPKKMTMNNELIERLKALRSAEGVCEWKNRQETIDRAIAALQPAAVGLGCRGNGGEMAITGETSDGYHTFNELYEHRCTLFLSLLKLHPESAWISATHDDGSQWDGWFIAGMETSDGPITYHLPAGMWSLACDAGIKCREKAPAWDGHTSGDVVQRLQRSLVKQLATASRADKDGADKARLDWIEDKGAEIEFRGNSGYRWRCAESGAGSDEGADTLRQAIDAAMSHPSKEASR